MSHVGITNVLQQKSVFLITNIFQFYCFFDSQLNHQFKVLKKVEVKWLVNENWCEQAVEQTELMMYKEHFYWIKSRKQLDMREMLRL